MLFAEFNIGPSYLNARFMVWLTVTVLLMTALLISWRTIEPEATQTAYIVAAKSMLERANELKQIWLVKKSPSRLIIDGDEYRFNPYGWPVFGNENSHGCQKGLQALFPEEDIFGEKLLSHDFHQIEGGYICRYNYPDNNAIVIKLVNSKFLVSAEFFDL